LPATNFSDVMSGQSFIAAESPTIEWDNFAKFVRQLSHDLRNQLNAAELQAALLNELTADPELKSEVTRLRELVAKLGATLQELSATVAPPCPTCLPYSANDLLEDLQKKIAEDFPEQSKRVKWEVSANAAMLNIDPGLIAWVLRELFDNAFRHGGSGELIAHGRGENGHFTFQLREPKSETVTPAKWNEPLSVIKHGHYGLGLKRARAILSAHEGKLTSEFDSTSSMLTSEVILPCFTKAN
jgi:K+-sensing histidine kinase KdpD